MFHEVSEKILDWLNGQPYVHEESLTDFLLFESSRLSSRITYHMFSRHEEAQNGTDWEWWVLLSQFAYRFRVQAKKIKRKNDNYPAVAYANNNGMQIDLLMRSAKEDAAFPLYMFYSSAPYDNEEAIKNCPFPEVMKMIDWCNECDNGAFLSSAYMVYEHVFARARTFLSAEALLGISLKLSTLDIVFDEQYAYLQIDTNIERYLNSLNSYYIHHASVGNEQEEQPIDGFRYHYPQQQGRGKELPHWLSYWMEQNSENSQLPEWFETEFQHQLPLVTGVVVVDMRRQYEE